jgi:hypothetical protein
MAEYDAGFEIVSDSHALSALPIIRRELDELQDGVLRHLELAENAAAGDSASQSLIREPDFNISLCRALDKTMNAVSALADRVEYLLRTRSSSVK